MAIMWNGSLIPWTDPDGAPYAGAKAYFFNAGTTTPRTVYIDSGLGESHDHPVVANASGKFPAIFLPEGDYRLRIETSAGVVLDDVDGISAPPTEAAEGGGGDTPVELLARTGDLKDRYGVGSHSGWVRANARTIGDAASGATERANADCEDLFLYLWGADANLTVSGGRGATAAGDWAASKTIALPDLRGRARVGLGSMGSSASGRIDATLLDGGATPDTLGATGGVDDVTLDLTQIPSHNHGGSTSTTGNHSHAYSYQGTPSIVQAGSGSTRLADAPESANTSSAGSHAHTIPSAGGGLAHTNLQPSMLVTVYIKL